MWSEEKRAWVYLVISAASYGVYLASWWAGRGYSVAQVSYVPALLSTAGAR